MKKITLVLALLLISFISYAQQGPFLYQVEANWLAECDAATPLITEDFENSTASGGLGCGTILSSDVATICFPVGELEDGFEITASDGGLTFYGAPGQVGANQDTPVVGVVGGIAESTVVTFTTPVTRVALDVFGISNSLGNGVIRVFDTDNNLLQTFDIDVTIGEFKFFGIHSSTLIGNVELQDTDNGDGLIFGNLRFGTCQVNDDPGTAIALTVGDVFEDAPVTRNNNFASDSQLVDPTIPIPECASYNGADIWFSAVVPASGFIAFETQGVDGSTITDGGMAVYTEDLSTILDCDDDGGDGLFSRIFLADLTPGAMIFVRVWEFGGNAFGEFTISAYNFSPPPNDLIENAIDVDEIGFPYTDSDIDFPTATGDQITNSGCNGLTQNSVWYKFTTTGAGTITASFEDPTNNDNKIIRFYTAANENATLVDLTFVNSGTNTCGFNIELSFEADANQTYYAFAQASTTVQTVNIDFTAAPPPPPNDLIENAIDVDEIGFPYTDSDIDFPNATGDQITNSGCNGLTQNSVWYKFTTTGAGTITASFEDPTNNDNKIIRFYTAANENATLDDLTFVNSGTNTCGFNIELSFEADANQTYYAFAQASTTVQTVNIDFTPAPPPNDLIENAIDVDELGFPYTDSDIDFPNATGDQITNTGGCNASSTENSVWYKFTTTETGIITASFEDLTNNDNKTIIFYTAASENATLDDLTFVNSGTNTCGFNIELSFEADANQTYYAFAQASTTVQTININFTPAPPNDLIENAIDVDELGFPYTDSDIDFPNATGDAVTNSNGCDIVDTFNSVWYKFTTTADGLVTASFTTNDPQSAVIFYTATDENATLDSLTVVDIGADTCLFNDGATFEAIGNQTYYAAVLSAEIGSITIESDALLSTEENTIEGFSFFPNPVEDILNISATQSIDQVILYNIAGQKVLDQNIGTSNSQLQLGNLKSGIYLMTARSGAITSTYKIIKK